ncbi:MAG: hypothetical protein EPN33_03210 [Acidobacteria bacterium]|nr:MAG: hypothetical protein EPN33_03210 [Acidobacteriota bacterium]
MGPNPSTSPPPANPARTAEVLRTFFLDHPEVQLSEAGRPLTRLGGKHTGYALHPDAQKLVGHFWSPDANLVRRILGVHHQGNQRLELDVLRLGRTRPSRLTLSTAHAAACAGPDRLAFRQAIAASAQQEWRGWSLAPEHGATPERSPIQRFLYRRQKQLLVCVALDGESSGSPAAAGVLTALAQALVWAEQCRQREPRSVLAAVRLILPPGGETWLRLLRPGLRVAPPLQCYRWDRSAARLDPVALSDAGNSTSVLRRVPAANDPGAEATDLLARVRSHCPQATWETSPDGYGYIAVYGLEVVRESNDPALAPFVFGTAGEQTPLLPATDDLFSHWLAAVAMARVPGGHRNLPLYALQPERWLAHLLRHDPSALDARLRSRRVYAEVPIATPAGAGVLDLLALDQDGRLIVLELKTSENLEFPLQALLYWLQVRQHQLQGDFERLGYFAGHSLSAQPPLLWMIAPALRWHPKTHLLTRWFSPDVPCELIGLNEEWRQRLQIIFRRPST